MVTLQLRADQALLLNKILSGHVSQIGDMGNGGFIRRDQGEVELLDTLNAAIHDSVQEIPVHG